MAIYGTICLNRIVSSGTRNGIRLPIGVFFVAICQFIHPIMKDGLQVTGRFFAGELH